MTNMTNIMEVMNNSMMITMTVMDMKMAIMKAKMVMDMYSNRRIPEYYTNRNIRL